MTSPKKPHAFVITQLGDEGSGIRARTEEVAEYVLKPALDSVGMELVRADRMTPGTITEQIAQSIASAEVVIADLSGRNVNVYYELGLAHAWRKPVVLLVDVVASLPFDLRQERVIELGTGELAVRRAEQARASLSNALTAVLADDHTPQAAASRVAATVLASPTLNSASRTPVFVGGVEERLAEIGDGVRQILSELRDHGGRVVSGFGEQDGLTGLQSRASFDSFSATAAARADRLGLLLAVALVDLDNFKQINDTYGHAVGDDALVAVARVLQRAVRPGDIVARLGGDEFVVLFDGLADENELLQLQASLRAALDSVELAGEPPIPVRGSVGLAIREPGSDFGATLLRADEAMYEQKRGRRSA